MISLLCPTRRRRDRLEAMWASAKETASGPLELVIYTDDDDQSYEELAADIRRVNGPRICLSEMWNHCYEASTGDILMHCGDDILFRTPGWDKVVIEAIERFPDRIVFVYGNDGSHVHDGRFGTHGFVHRRWVETVGYFVPPYFVSDWNDQWLNDVAGMIGRHVHLPILTEHMHYVFGKAAHDETYREREARGAAADVGAIYSAKHAEREADAAKLRAVMQ